MIKRSADAPTRRRRAEPAVFFFPNRPTTTLLAGPHVRADSHICTCRGISATGRLLLSLWRPVQPQAGLQKGCDSLEKSPRARQWRDSTRPRLSSRVSARNCGLMASQSEQNTVQNDFSDSAFTRSVHENTRLTTASPWRRVHMMHICAGAQRRSCAVVAFSRAAFSAGPESPHREETRAPPASCRARRLP